jgi:putative flippase GtrA
MTCQRSYKRVKLSQLVVGAAIPVVACLGLPSAIIATLAAFVVVAEGVQQLCQWHTNWVLYRSTAEALKHEKYLYLATAGPYSGDDRHRVLAERLEGLVSQEHAKWTEAREKEAQVHQPGRNTPKHALRGTAARRGRSPCGVGACGDPYTAAVSLVDAVLIWIPQPYRDVAIRHRELVKFAVVGGITYVVDITLFTLLKMTVLEPKPVTAKIVAVLVATIVSYVLNREWSFRTRGGRERHHEATLFFLLWISRYMLELHVPQVSLLAQETADFASANVIGTLLAMAFRWWAFRRYVFPDENVRHQVPIHT